MVGLKKVEDRPTPSAVYNIRVYFCAITAAMAAIMIGYESAFVGSVLSFESFQREFGLLDKTESERAVLDANIVSVYQAGGIAGAILGLPAGYYGGRKIGLLAAALVFCLGAGVTLAADSARGLGPMYGGRFVAGIGIGAASNLTPLYISEIAPPAIRGQLVGMYEIGWQLGGLVGFWIGYACEKHQPISYRQWAIPFAVQLIPAGLFAIAIPLVLKESPRWYVMKGRREKAIASLCYLRKLDRNEPYLVDEVNSMEIQRDHDEMAMGPGFFAPFKQLFARRELVARLFIVTSLFIGQNGTGINAINYYSPSVFQSLGVTGDSTALLTTGVFGVIKTVSSLIWAFLLVDRFGRRPILLIGCVGCAISMYIIGGYIVAENPTENATGGMSAAGRTAIAFFYIWTFSYSVSWNGSPWIVCSESFPGQVRQVVQMAAACSNWLWNFVISRATPTMLNQMGGGTYLFFASFTVLSGIFIALLLPETKNVPLEEMDRLWQYKPWGANKRVMSELQRERGTRLADQPPEFLHKGKPAMDGTATTVENAERKQARATLEGESIVN